MVPPGENAAEGPPDCRGRGLWYNPPVMAISVNDLRAGIIFEDSGEIYRVEKYFHQKHSRAKAVIRITARTLRSGKLKEFRFASGQRVEEAEVEGQVLQLLYHDQRQEQLVFLDAETKQRISVDKERLAGWKFLKEGGEVQAFLDSHSAEVISLEIPLKVDLAVTEAGSSEKGDSAGSVTKPVTLETGAVIQAPMFIKVGDLVRVRTETGEYVERVRG